MATIPDRVIPGGVITSDLINRIIDKLNELDQRGGGSGGTTEPQVMTSFDPPRQQAVGATLTIFGNFESQLSANTVMIDSTQIPPASFLGGSRSTQIMFDIPESIVVDPGDFKNVMISVQTATKGTGRMPYTLLPKEVSPIADPRIDLVKNLDNVSAPDNTVETSRRASIRGTNLVSALAPPAIVTLVAHDPTTGNEIRIPPPIVSRSNTEIVVNIPEVPGASTSIVSATIEVVLTGNPHVARKDVFVMAP